MKRRKWLIGAVVLVACAVGFMCYLHIDAQREFDEICHTIFGDGKTARDARDVVDQLCKFRPTGYKAYYCKKKMIKLMEDETLPRRMNKVIWTIFNWQCHYDDTGERCGVDVWTKDSDQHVLTELVDRYTKHCIEEQASRRWIYKKMPDGSLHVWFVIIMR